MGTPACDADSDYTHYIYIYIRVQIRGRSCADGFGRYKAACIGCTTTKCSACCFFCSYKMKNITLSGSENNSKPVLQIPMHLKLKK